MCLNRTIHNEKISANELKNKIKYLEYSEKEYIEIIDELNDKVDKLKNNKTNLKSDNKKLQKRFDKLKNEND